MQNDTLNDDRGDEINARITKLAQALMGAIMQDADAIRPFEAGLVAEVGLRFADLSSDAAGAYFLERASTYLAESGNATFTENLSEGAAANLILNLPITSVLGDPNAGVNKRLALETAETLGPDWAQALYRFAVLVTKLA